jgi:hypothetical protein
MTHETKMLMDLAWRRGVLFGLGSALKIASSNDDAELVEADIMEAIISRRERWAMDEEPAA